MKYLKKILAWLSQRMKNVWTWLNEPGDKQDDMDPDELQKFLDRQW
jgi:hypothetical protein